MRVSLREGTLAEPRRGIYALLDIELRSDAAGVAESVVACEIFKFPDSNTSIPELVGTT